MGITIAQLPEIGAFSSGDFIVVSIGGKDYKISKANAGIGGGSGKYRIPITAGAWRYPNTGFAPYETFIGSNQKFENNSFSGSLDQYLEREIILPVGLTIPTNVDLTFFYLATGTGFVDFELDSLFRANGEDPDIAYTNNNSVGFSVVAANVIYAEKVTVTAASLGLVTGDIYGKLKLNRLGLTDANTGACKINAMLLEFA